MTIQLRSVTTLATRAIRIPWRDTEWLTPLFLHLRFIFFEYIVNRRQMLSARASTFKLCGILLASSVPDEVVARNSECGRPSIAQSTEITIEIYTPGTPYNKGIEAIDNRVPSYRTINLLRSILL